MRAGLTVSATLHVGLLVLAIVGLGAGKPLIPPAVDSIAVDLVPVSEFTNVRMGVEDSKVVETETPSTVQSDKPAELAKPTGNTEQDQPKPADNAKVTPAPTEQTAPTPTAAEPPPAEEPQPQEVAAADPPVDTPEPAPTPPEPVADQPVAAPTVTEDPANAAPKVAERPDLKARRAAFKKAEDQKKAEEQKKKDDKKKAEEAKKLAEKKDADAKKLADEVANIINDEQSRGATTGEGGEPTLGKESGKAATLSQSEIDGLVAQIKNCINLPPGAEEAQISVRLQFTIDADGRVTQQPVLMSAPASPLEQAYASATQRAVMRCGPYQVTQQEVSAIFTPQSY